MGTAPINMKAVLRLTGLSPDVLRAWEKRYSAVQPRRTASGRRVYSQQEVNRLKLLAELVRAGHSIGQIAGRPDRDLLALASHSRLTGYFGNSAELDERIRELLGALEKFNLIRIRMQLARIRYELSPRDFIFYLVPQLMIEVGKQIDLNLLSIAQEHALSEIVKQHLRQVYDGLEPLDGTRAKGNQIIFAAPEGHLHEFGLLLSAVLCRYQGFACNYLGSNVPATSLAQAANRTRAHAIVLSVSLVPSEEKAADPQKYCLELDKALDAHCEIWVGGGASSLIRRKAFKKRRIWIFESLDTLEQKLAP